MRERSVDRCLRLAGVLVLLLAIPACTPFWASHDHTSSPGTIQFGAGIHRVSAYEIDIVKKKSTFYLGQSMAWVAHLKHRAGTRTLTLQVLSDGSQQPVLRETISAVNPRWVTIANPGELVQGLQALGVPIPGKYILRYSRGSVRLAEGTFRLRR